MGVETTRSLGQRSGVDGRLVAAFDTAAGGIARPPLLNGRATYPPGGFGAVHQSSASPWSNARGIPTAAAFTRDDAMPIRQFNDRKKPSALRALRRIPNLQDVGSPHGAGRRRR